VIIFDITHSIRKPIVTNSLAHQMLNESRTHLHIRCSDTKRVIQYHEFVDPSKCHEHNAPINLHELTLIDEPSRTHFDRKKPPLPGGFSIYYVLRSRAVCKRFHDEMRRSHLVVETRTHGNTFHLVVETLDQEFPRRDGMCCCVYEFPRRDGSGKHSTKNPPRGGGSPAINWHIRY